MQRKTVTRKLKAAYVEKPPYFLELSVRLCCFFMNMSC